MDGVIQPPGGFVRMPWPLENCWQMSGTSPPQKRSVYLNQGEGERIHCRRG